MFTRHLVSVLAASAACLSSAVAQSPTGVIEPRGTARPPNADGFYQALRNASPAGDGVQVKEFSLERQGGNFHFSQGSFYFYSPVNGKVTGAVFLGNGHFDLTPKDASERHSLSLLNKSGVMAQDFTTLVLRFTDGTEQEIRKASSGSGGPTPGQANTAATDLAKGLRLKLHENFDERLLDDVVTPEADIQNNQYFLASFRMGGTFTGRNVLFVVDPEAADEVSLSTWSDEGSQTWAGYKMQGAQGERGLAMHVTAEKLDITFEKSGTLHGSAETTIKVQRDGLRVVRLALYPTLRVSGVYTESGDPIDYIQEKKDDDPGFAVILPAPAKRGSTVRVLTTYGGPDAIRHDGDGMYYLLSDARESWYPAGGAALGAYADFHMTFHVPKGLQIVATGKEISHEKDANGGQRVVWESGEPIAVAGFNLGDFVAQDTKTPQGFTVQAYANAEVPDGVKSLLHAVSGSRNAPVALGNMSTVPALKGEVAQGSAAIQVYTDFFGKLPYDHVALTEQSACNFGQSWPMLVYLPICGFWDSTIQQQLGLLDGGARSYWTEVTPHEVSHQWWGTLVGFDNYRDQWMSEGFANFSVSLYLAATSKTLTDFRDFWAEQHRNLVTKNTLGVRPIDVGPLTMGYRVSNEKTGRVYQDLIYSKGAYVMHMLQVMYWTPEQGDAPFKHSMQEFVKEHSGRPASTEDLKFSFEKTMPKWVDLAGDGKLDWFFNEYIYGTELPHYDITGDFTTADGDTSVHLKVTQANVSKDFLMMVPVYLQLSDGRTLRLLNLSMKGDMTFDRTIKIGKLPAAPKKMLLNYNADILSD